LQKVLAAGLGIPMREVSSPFRLSLSGNTKGSGSQCIIVTSIGLRGKESIAASVWRSISLAALLSLSNGQSAYGDCTLPSGLEVRLVHPSPQILFGKPRRVCGGRGSWQGKGTTQIIAGRKSGTPDRVVGTSADMARLITIMARGKRYQKMVHELARRAEKRRRCL